MAIRYGPYKIRTFVQNVRVHCSISQGRDVTFGRGFCTLTPLSLAPHGGQPSRELPSRQPQRRVLYKLGLLWLGYVGHEWTQRMHLPSGLFFFDIAMVSLFLFVPISVCFVAVL